MITVRKLRRVERGRELVDLALSSNDAKPTNVINGSKCIEVDTGDSYIYDEENTDWNKISSGSGGGAPLIVKLVYSNDETHLDATFGEIYDAFINGQSVICFFNENAEIDPRYGTYGMLESVDIIGNADEGVYANLQFEGSGYYTNQAQTVDLLMEETVYMYS